MKKKQQMIKKSALTTHKETLHLLWKEELRGVIGKSRIHIPIGYQDDTTPIYDDRDDIG